MNQCLMKNGVYTVLLCASCFTITDVEERGGLLCKYSVYAWTNIATQLCHHSMLDLISVQLKIPA